ncbi:helix-turn-helix domain-containing protein [Luteolibacter marinus]|uniref:helix-turn-helix domain-containing protein n=1 Tax=Luteolibacter marinus TaxID=2776705 RepID=UPI0018694F37|nr:helix-turn-helix domain-containing protein [Luteolibacter marinus]
MHHLAEPSTSIASLRHIDDHAAFARLPQSVQSDVLVKLGWMIRLENAGHGAKGGIVEAAADALDVSATAINRYLRRFRKRGWKGLIDKRSRGVGAKGLPVRFQEHVRGLYDTHSRTDDGAEVHKTLVADWHLWRATQDPQHAIPGYAVPPKPDPKTRLPHGWSLENIRRLCPPEYQRSRGKQGNKAASKHLPSVLTTRIGSAFLARICFDDQQYDNMLADGVLALSGITEASRPVGFNAIDFATAFHFPHHLRLLYKDTEEDRKKTLTSEEFTWVVVNLLLTEGYRTDDLGTELIFEWKTANAWANKQFSTLNGFSRFEDAVKAVTQGKCWVSRSGKFDKPMFADMYFRPQVSGNFKFKTWIESAFRLVRTMMQALPGPTGRHFELAPEELHGIQKRERQLLTAIADHLSPRHAAMIRHQLLSFQEFAELVSAVYRAINARTDHHLEGWPQLGYTRQIWRSRPESDLWFERHELPEDEIERSMILRRLNANPDELTRELYLSPEQAAAMGRRDPAIRKFQHEWIPLVIPREWSKTVTVGKDHCVTLPNPLWPTTKEQYVARLKTRTGHETLQAGTKLVCYPNPINPDELAVCHPDGGFLGVLHRVVRAAAHDTAAKLAQLEVRAQVERDLSTPLHLRLGGIAEQRTERERHNQRILDGKPVLPEEIAQARHEAGVKGRKTAAENRNKQRGETRDWDAWTPPTSDDFADADDLLGSLPDETPLPDSL